LSVFGEKGTKIMKKTVHTSRKIYTKLVILYMKIINRPTLPMEIREIEKERPMKKISIYDIYIHTIYIHTTYYILHTTYYIIYTIHKIYTYFLQNIYLLSKEYILGVKNE